MDNQGVVNIIVADYNMPRLMKTLEELQKIPMLKVVGIAQSSKDAIDRTTSMAVDALLTEYTMTDGTAIELCQEVNYKSPGTAVFAISDTSNAQFVFSAKRAGIIEVFSRESFNPIDIGQKIIDHVYNVRTEKTGNMKMDSLSQKIASEYITKSIPQSVILTYNTKGGVGKSSIAANLALAIKISPYMARQRVALVDFDCWGANVSTLYNIPDSDAQNRNLSFWETITQVENITVHDVDDLMIEGPHGLMILPAPPNFVAAEKLTYELFDKIICVLKQFFSIIVIDGAPNISASMDVALHHATRILLIANSEGQSVKQLARTTSLLSPDPDFPEKPDMTNILNKMFVVINHAQGYCKWDLKPDEVVQTIGRPLLAEIPFSETVREALHRDTEQQALELETEGEYAKAIKQLANDLVGAYPEGIETEQKKNVIKNDSKKGGFLGLFRKDN